MTLHCADCGTALTDRELLLGRDLCESCQAEDDRLYGPEDAQCRLCGAENCWEDCA